MKLKGFCLILVFFFINIFADEKTLYEKIIEKSQLSLSLDTSKACKEKPFVILITSYNNAEWCRRNLLSVYEQKYSNYRVIYIDDCSSDETYEKANDFIHYLKEDERTILVRNDERKGKVYNFFHAIHTCNDDEIIVELDGDDWYAHENVLNTLNSYYQKNDLWLTYGQFIYYPMFVKGGCRPFDKKILDKVGYRGHIWIASQLRTFYASLFKKIHLKHLFYKENWIQSAGDCAYMYPMLEMSANHQTCISEILYIYNRNTPINDDKIDHSFQLRMQYYLASLEPYESLKVLSDQKNALDTAILIYSKNTMQSFQMLVERLKSLKNVYIIYDEKKFNPSEFDSLWEQINESKINIFYYKTSESLSLLNRIYFDDSAEYIFCVNEPNHLHFQLEEHKIQKILQITHADILDFVGEIKTEKKESFFLENYGTYDFFKDDIDVKDLSFSLLRKQYLKNFLTDEGFLPKRKFAHNKNIFFSNKKRNKNKILYIFQMPGI